MSVWANSFVLCLGAAERIRLARSLGYSREKTRVLAGQLKSYVSIIEHHICLYFLLHPVLFVIYHILSTFKAVRTVKTSRHY